MKASVLFLATAVIATAQAPAVNLRYPELNLKNGTVATDVTILSFDPEQRTVNVLTGKSLKKLDVQLLPDDVVKRLETLHPRRSEPERIKLLQRAADAELALQRAARRELETQSEARAIRDAQRTVNINAREKETTRDAATEDLVLKTAVDYAQYYFKYQNDPHSSVGAVLDSNLQMGDPEIVPGWTGRWRIAGSAGIAYSSNTGGSLGRKNKEFEVLVEIPAKGKPKVVELRIK